MRVAWSLFALGGLAAGSCTSQVKLCADSVLAGAPCAVDDAHLQACSCSAGAGGAVGGAGGAGDGAGGSREPAGSGGSAGGAGPPLACEPGAAVACYDGPKGTLGVGACQGGFALCDPDGLGVGPCVGEVLPAPDDCATPADERCTTEPSACVDDPPWSRQVGVEALYGALDVDALEDVAVAGQVDGQLDFGGGALGAASPSAYLALVDSAGVQRWSKVFPGALVSEARAVAFDGAAVVMAGRFAGTLDLGLGPLDSGGLGDVFLAAYDLTGAPLWAKSYPGPGDDGATSLAIDAQGDVLVTGVARSALNYGLGPLPVAPAAAGAFLAGMDAHGKPLFARVFAGGAGSELGGTSVAVGPAGDVTLLLQAQAAGAGALTVDLGGGPRTGTLFVVRLDPTGAHLWSNAYTGGELATPFQQHAAMRVDDLGAVVLTGSFTGSLDLGGAPLVAQGTSVYAAKLDAGGAHVWSRVLADRSSASGLALDAAGDAQITGGLGSPLLCEGGYAAGGGAHDAFVATLDPMGRCLTASAFGDGSAQFGRAIALTGFGHAVVLGSFLGAVDFGTGALSSHGDPGVPSFDTFLVKLGSPPVAP